MKYRTRTHYTDSQKAVMWERWRAGWTLHQIALQVIDRLLVDYAAKKTLYLSWNAASWHDSKQLKKYVEKHNSEVLNGRAWNWLRYRLAASAAAKPEQAAVASPLQRSHWCEMRSEASVSLRLPGRSSVAGNFCKLHVTPK